MIGNYSFLNKAYFSLLALGIAVLAFSGISALLAQAAYLTVGLGAGIALVLAGGFFKILVWYNVYSEVVTKEEFKRVTASGTIFQKKKREK